MRDQTLQKQHTNNSKEHEKPETLPAPPQARLTLIRSSSQKSDKLRVNYLTWPAIYKGRRRTKHKI